MGNPAQKRDGVARRGALIEHHADDQDAGEARLPGSVVDLMQADAEPVLVQAVEAAGEAVGEADAGVDALRLDSDQDPVVMADIVVVVAAVQATAHHRRAAARRIAQAGIRVFRDRALEGDFQAVGQAVQFLPDVGRIRLKRSLGVPEAEGEGPAFAAAAVGPAARRFEKAFSHLLADIVGTSPAFQDIDTPWLGHSPASPLRRVMVLPVAFDRQSKREHDGCAAAGLHSREGRDYTF